MRIEDRYTKSLRPPWQRSLFDRSLVKSLPRESTEDGLFECLPPSKGEEVEEESRLRLLSLSSPSPLSLLYRDVFGEYVALAVPDRRLKRGPIAKASAEAASPSKASWLRAAVREPSRRCCWRRRRSSSSLTPSAAAAAAAASALSSPSAGTGNASSRCFGATQLRPNESEREEESSPPLFRCFGVTLPESPIWEGFPEAPFNSIA